MHPTTRPRLSPEVIAAIKDDLALGMMPKAVAARNNCSVGAVENYRRPGHKRQYRTYNTSKPAMVDAVVAPIGPNLLPWMTVEMLKCRRAPVARCKTTIAQDIA